MYPFGSKLCFKVSHDVSAESTNVATNIVDVGLGRFYVFHDSFMFGINTRGKKNVFYQFEISKTNPQSGRKPILDLTAMALLLSLFERFS